MTEEMLKNEKILKQNWRLKKNKKMHWKIRN